MDESDDRIDLGLVLKSRDPNFTLLFPAGNEKTRKIALATTKYIKAAAEISVAHSIGANQKEILIAQKIGGAEKTLVPYGFLRVHKSYLVNMSFIEPMEKVGDTICLIGGEMVPLARRRKAKMTMLFRKYGLLIEPEKSQK